MTTQNPYLHLSTLKWTEQDYKDLCALLASLAEDAYRDFVLKGIFTNRPMLGVRVPAQRLIAATISKGDNSRTFLTTTRPQPALHPHHLTTENFFRKRKKFSMKNITTYHQSYCVIIESWGTRPPTIWPDDS